MEVILLKIVPEILLQVWRAYGGFLAQTLIFKAKDFLGI